jgi:Flp pilus assembly pilin Flp
MSSSIRIQDESGQGLMEYSLILSFVTIVAVAALSLLGAGLLGLPGWNLF